MTKRLQSKFKVYKQFGVQLWDKFKVIPPKKRTKGAKPNLVENANKYAGIHGYAVKWTEKQIFKKFYGNISEKQLKKYVTISKSTKDPMSTFIQHVESRLDVIIYRMMFADTVFSARQLINHGHITVNSRVITKPSYLIRPGDVIAPALGPSEPLSAINENSGLTVPSGTRSAILIFENIVRRMVMIFKLNAKSLTYSFGRSVVIKGQPEPASPKNPTRGADELKYLKLLKMACSSEVIADSTNTKPAGKNIKKPAKISVQSAAKPASLRDSQKAPSTLIKAQKPSQFKNGDTVTFEVNNPENRLSAISNASRNSNAQITSASILKSLDSRALISGTKKTAKSKHEPSIGNLGSQALRVSLNQKNRLAKARTPGELAPYIKINFPLLTGIYLRHPEITEITYPKKLKFHLNRILNFHK